MNSLQWRKSKFSSELTDSNSLAQALLTKPEISNTLAYAFGERFYLQYLTQGVGKVSNKYKVVGNSEYMWPLMGHLTKPITISGQVSPTGKPGVNFTPFTVPFAEKYFALGDLVEFDSKAQARVQTEPIQIGNDFIYTFQLVTSDTNSFVPASDLVIGREASVIGTAFEEFSEGGSSKEAFPMWFKNQMTTSRMSWGMSGSAKTDVMLLEITRNGKKSSLWMYEKEYQNMLIWQSQAERMRWYGKYNRTPGGEVHLPGKNGRPVLSGAGVLEQIAKSNRQNYTEGSEEIYRNFIADLAMNAKDAENKKFIAFTGRGGMDEFTKAMRDAIKGSMIVDSNFVTKSGENLKLSREFITYRGLMGTELTLVYNPLFDDPEHNRVPHYKTALPLESYRMTVLDFSEYGGEANISMITKGADGENRSMVQWYTAGSTTPEANGISAKMVMRSNSLDGFFSHYLSETSMKVTNPLSCGELVCIAA